MTVKIILLGASLSAGNRGVNALTRGTISSLISFFRKKNLSIRILSYNVRKEISHTVTYMSHSIDVYESPINIKKSFSTLIKHNFRKLPTKIATVLNTSDYIFDLSQGDSFSDIYGLKRYMMHTMIKKYAIKNHLNIYLLPQTIGPFNNYLVRKDARKIIKGVNQTFVRDSLSLRYTLETLKISPRKCYIIPDMAFFMQPADNVRLSDFLPKSQIDNRKIIGINISGLLYNGGYTQKNMFNFKVSYKKVMDEIIEFFLKKSNTTIVLIPHVIETEMKVEDDLSTCLKILDKYRHVSQCIFAINKPLREDEIKQIISQCDFFVGGRMHACIGAISSNVPTVPIAYSRKFRGIWNDMGLEECIADPRSQHLEEILNVVDISYRNSEKIRGKLIVDNQHIKAKILSMFDIIINKQVKK